MARDEKKTASDLFRVKVFSPFETFFDDQALSLTAANETGPFDILAGHANFLTLLIPCTITIRNAKGGQTKLPIQRGVLHVRADQATVFLNI